jgi:hypothetical protein
MHHTIVGPRLAQSGHFNRANRMIEMTTFSMRKCFIVRGFENVAGIKRELTLMGDLPCPLCIRSLQCDFRNSEKFKFRCRLCWERQQEEVSMQKRFQYGKAYPEAYKAMLALSQAVEKTGLAPQLIDLSIIAYLNSMAVHFASICIRRTYVPAARPSSVST